VTGPSKKVSGSTRYSSDKNKKLFSPGDWQQFSQANLSVASSRIKRCLVQGPTLLSFFVL
jgi:hypothetical protein